MDFAKLKAYLQSLYASSPAGQINGALAQGASAAGVPAGASPLTDAISQGANRAASNVSNAMPNMPDGVNSAVNTGNHYLDMLHDKLFGLFNGK